MHNSEQIALENVCFRYPGETNPVVRDINLLIREHEFVTITGRTGSGKSTLAYVLAGLIPRAVSGHLEGEIRILGLDPRKAPVREFSQQTGIVFQNAESQLVGLTVEEDVHFGLENLALPVQEIKERTQWALKTVRLDGYEQRSPWTLSGGEKQRVVIASVLAMRPKVMILDNPTAELDPIGKKEIIDTICELNRKLGITIVIFEQENEEILSIASRVIVLDKGAKVMDGTPKEVFSRAEELIDMGIKVPQVTELSVKLKQAGLWHTRVPVVLDEAVPMYREVVPQSNVKLPASASSPLGEPLIEVSDLHYSYTPDQPVLRGVSLTVRRGEFVVVMGPNGSGKTTLAKHLNGLLKPTSGEVRVMGTPTTDATVAGLSRKVGYVFQNPDHQIFNKTIADELAFGPRNLGWDEERIDSAVDRVISDVGLGVDKLTDPFFIGIAQRKMLAIASILIMEPEVLILDEPATGADWTVCIRIMDYARRLHERGLTIVMITHDVAIAAMYAQRVVVMNDGNITIDGPVSEVLADVESLKVCHVRPPQMHYLFSELADKGLPSQVLTVEDGFQVLKSALGGKPHA